MQCHDPLTCSTLVAPGTPANVTAHCTSVLLLVHHVADNVTVETVTALALVPTVIARLVAVAAPKVPATVAVPAARGRSLFNSVELPRFCISLAVATGVELMVELAACKRQNG